MAAAGTVHRLTFAASDFFGTHRCGSLGSLATTRGLGRSQPAAFNRQVAMYLAKHLGRWTTTIIGRFYSGRNRSTVCYCIQRMATPRKTHPEIEALVDLARLYRVKP